MDSLMNKLIKVCCIAGFSFLIIACGGGSESSSQNYVYIDPSATDNGNGSESSPYNTFNGVVFQRGTSFLIRRGTVLYEQLTVSSSGTASEPVIIGAYGTGSDPVIDGSELVTDWVASGGDIYSSTLAPAADYGRGNVTIDGVIQKIVTGIPASGEYAISSDGTVQIHSNPSGKTVRLSRRYFGIKGTGVSNIVIRNIHVRQASLHGIHFEDSHNIIIQNCKIEICGGAYIGAIQAGNGIEFGDSSSGCRVSDSTVTDILDSGISPQTYSHNQMASDFIFSGNIIKRCGFAGIEVAALYNSGNADNSSISDVLIEDNEISFCGKGWSGIRYTLEGRGIKINADIDGANNTRYLSGIFVRRCVVKENAGEGIFISGRSGSVTVDRSLIILNDRGGVTLQETQPTDMGLRLTASIIRENSGGSIDGVAVNVVSSTGDILIYHNTFYDNGRYGLVFLNGSLGSSHVTNNIFHSSAVKWHLVTVPGMVLTSVGNNFFTEFSGNDIIGYNNIAYQNASTFNGSERSGNISGSDPGLVSGADLNLSGTGSPCYHTGLSGTGVNYDYSGNSFNSTPSIGAFEY